MSIRRNARRNYRPGNSTIWRPRFERSDWRRPWTLRASLAVVLLAATDPPPTSAFEPPTVGAGAAFTSEYRTRTLSDTLNLLLPNLAGRPLTVDVGLRRFWMETIAGRTQRQSHRSLFASWTRSAVRHGPFADLRFTEDRVEEFGRRRFRRGRLFAGYRLPGIRGSTVEIAGGGTASSHRSGRVQDDDVGAGLRAATHGRWRLGQRANARLRFERLIDWRQKVPVSHTRFSTESGWRYSANDSLVAELRADWTNTDFYPDLDDFSGRARQRHRARSVTAAWTHSRNSPGGGILSDLGREWSVVVDAALTSDDYDIRAGGPTAGRLPSDYRLNARGYTIRWNPKVGPGGVRATYRYRHQDEEFGIRARNQERDAGELDLLLGSAIGAADSLFGRAFYRVESFTTPPDSGFFDDRDLATRILEAGWRRRFHADFEMTARFSFRGFHQIFVAPELSGSNNTSDIYYFAPQMRWSPFRTLVMTSKLAIRAHYRFLDFRKSADDDPGTLYRGVESTSRLTIAPRGAHASAALVYTYRYEDFGPLVWREKWLQRVDWDRRIHITGAEGRIALRRNVTLHTRGTWETKQPFDHERAGDDPIVRTRGDRFRRWTAGAELTVRTDAGTEVLLSYRRRDQRRAGQRADATDKLEFSIRTNL